MMASSAERAAVETPRLLVLVVEDDADARNGTMAVLQAAGYEVVGASTGPEALGVLWATGTKPALILLDLMMPGMAGWQLREKIMDDPVLAHVPIVFMSGYRHTLETIQNGAARGAAGVLKPVDPDELLEARPASRRPVDPRGIQESSGHPCRPAP